MRVIEAFVGLEDNENAKELRKFLSPYSPSDYITLDREADIRLISLWAPIDEEYHRTPADVFFTKTVPLEDCDIVVDESGDENGRVMGCRVHIAEDYGQIVDKASADGELSYGVGLITVDNGLGDILWYSGIFVNRDDDYISLTNPVFTKKQIIQTDAVINSALETTASFMHTWYGIQIALLHPEIKDVFSRPKIEALHEPVTNAPQRKRKTKYIKKHIIRAEDIDAALKKASHGNANRKCLAWYVIGHWRTYKNGKKVFIAPYWKGVMRGLKRNTKGDERERIMA